MALNRCTPSIIQRVLYVKEFTKNNSKNKQTNRLNVVYEKTRFKPLPGSSGESFPVTGHGVSSAGLI